MNRAMLQFAIAPGVAGAVMAAYLMRRRRPPPPRWPWAWCEYVVNWGVVDGFAACAR